MAWFETNLEDSLRHWFGGLIVVYDGDPNAPSAAPPAPAAARPGNSGRDSGQVDCAGGKRGSGQMPAAKADVLQGQPGPEGDNHQQQQQQQQRYMFGFQPHGLYPTGNLCIVLRWAWFLI
jgi:hypothetical protein